MRLDVFQGLSSSQSPCSGLPPQALPLRSGTPPEQRTNVSIPAEISFLEFLLWAVGKKHRSQQRTCPLENFTSINTLFFFFNIKVFYVFFNNFRYRRLFALILGTHDRPLLDLRAWIPTSVIQMNKFLCSYKKPWRQSKWFLILEMIPYLYLNIQTCNKAEIICINPCL